MYDKIHYKKKKRKKSAQLNDFSINEKKIWEIKKKIQITTCLLQWTAFGIQIDGKKEGTQINKYKIILFYNPILWKLSQFQPYLGTCHGNIIFWLQNHTKSFLCVFSDSYLVCISLEPEWFLFPFGQNSCMYTSCSHEGLHSVYFIPDLLPHFSHWLWGPSLFWHLLGKCKVI